MSLKQNHRSHRRARHEQRKRDRVWNLRTDDAPSSAPAAEPKQATAATGESNSAAPEPAHGDSGEAEPNIAAADYLDPTGDIVVNVCLDLAVFRRGKGVELRVDLPKGLRHGVRVLIKFGA